MDHLSMQFFVIHPITCMMARVKADSWGGSGMEHMI